MVEVLLQLKRRDGPGRQSRGTSARIDGGAKDPVQVLVRPAEGVDGTQVRADDINRKALLVDGVDVDVQPVRLPLNTRERADQELVDGIVPSAPAKAFCASRRTYYVSTATLSSVPRSRFPPPPKHCGK